MFWKFFKYGFAFSLGVITSVWLTVQLAIILG